MPNIRLYCEDCLRVLQSLPSNSVDMLLTDIPYDEENLRQISNIRNYVQYQPANLLTFDLDAFMVEILCIVTGSFYIFCGVGQVNPIRNYFMERGLTTRLCIWEKTNASPVNGEKFWLFNIETCIFARKSSATFNEHCKGVVWKFPRNMDQKLHPTQKPLPLFEYLIKASSNAGDIILDPCMGSGTTGVACKKLNRHFVGIEMNKEYFDIAKERIDFIGKLDKFWE